MQSMHITKASDSGCIESAGFLMELVSSECTQPGTKRCMHHTAAQWTFFCLLFANGGSDAPHFTRLSVTSGDDCKS